MRLGKWRIWHGGFRDTGTYDRTIIGRDHDFLWMHRWDAAAPLTVMWCGPRGVMGRAIWPRDRARRAVEGEGR